MLFECLVFCCVTHWTFLLLDHENGPTVVYALHKWLVSIFLQTTEASNAQIYTDIYMPVVFFNFKKLKKRLKMPPQTASGGISREMFRSGSPNFTRLSGTTGATNLFDMTSLVPSGRPQNASKYCTK